MCTAEVIHLLTTKFLRGDQTDVGSVAGVRRLKRALELLASNVMLECGELLMATGVLWTPNETDRGPATPGSPTRDNRAANGAENDDSARRLL